MSGGEAPAGQRQATVGEGPMGGGWKGLPVQTPDSGPGARVNT